MYGPQPVPMYGIQLANFRVSGTVKSVDQGLPVKGLFVKLRDTLNMSYAMDSGRTDSLGMYSLQFSTYPADNTWLLKVLDVDLNTNGSFKEKDTVISIPQTDIKDLFGEKTVDVEVDRSN